MKNDTWAKFPKPSSVSSTDVLDQDGICGFWDLPAPCLLVLLSADTNLSQDTPGLTVLMWRVTTYMYICIVHA